MISSIRYTAASPSTAVCITLTGGEEWHTDAALPPDTHLRAMMHDWMDGNAPHAFVAPPPVMADYQRAIAAHVDAVAQSRGYTDGSSCASYSGSGPWGNEAGAFKAWRDQVWLAAHAALATYQADGVAPDLGKLLAALPAIRWPA